MSPKTEQNDNADTTGERETKRRRSAPTPLDLSAAVDMRPDKIFDVIEDGDVLLIVSKLNGEEKNIGLRCSSATLSMASAVFKEALSTPVIPQAPATESSANATTPTALPTGKIISLPDEDGDTLLLILYILHFRNRELPAYIPPDKLIRIGILATRYRCSFAISRATTQWFDRIYSEIKSSGKAQKPSELLTLIQAACICDEAMYFARLTGRYVCTLPRPTSSNNLALTTLDNSSDGIKRLQTLLDQRQAASFASLRLDLDVLVEPCAIALGKESHHYIDCPPDTEPDESDLPVTADGTPDKPVVCVVDSQAVPAYLAALRNSGIWPPTTWAGKSAQQVIDTIVEFRVPDYDDSDKCDFCLPLVEEFAKRLMLVRKLHRERLWGLCLDCFNAGGVYEGECRFAHVKAG
ncbi:hypothetical protein Q7P37_004804 [Cladosporium fusiforme]